MSAITKEDEEHALDDIYAAMDAMHAASMVSEFGVAIEIARRHGLLGKICLVCRMDPPGGYKADRGNFTPDIELPANVELHTCVSCSAPVLQWLIKRAAVSKDELVRWMYGGKLPDNIEIVTIENRMVIRVRDPISASPPHKSSSSEEWIDDATGVVFWRDRG